MHGMRPFGDLLPKEEALARLLAAAMPLTRFEEVPLHEANGRVCAVDVHAPFAVPPFDRATMDGYAVRAADGPRLGVVGEAFAGARPPRVGAGEAVRIATGAPLPEGADAVIRVEDTAEDAGIVTLRVPARVGGSIDRAGSDLASGALVVARGSLLGPARLGLLASLGLDKVRVLARPRVGILTTGDELLLPGEAPAFGRIYESNGTTLRALFTNAGALVERVSRVGDELGKHREALRDAALACDLVVLSGGASVGAKDLVVDALDEVLFHGVRVKPGKPLLVGRKEGTLVVGLPGNPTSALSNAALFVVPAIRRMAGLPAEEPRVVDAALAVDVAGESQRFVFLPVRLEGGLAIPTFKGSGALSSLATSDGWVGVPEGVTLKSGTRVRVTLW